MRDNITNGKIYSAKSVDQLSKVLAGLDRGEVKPSALQKTGGLTSSPMSKVHRVQPGEMVPVYYIDPADPRGEYLARWMGKMNLADYRGGHKGSTIIGRRSKE